MKSKDIFSNNNIFINKDVKSKDEILVDISSHLLNFNYISNSEGFLNDILDRESRGSTYIYNYLAIPHGLSKYVIKSKIVIYKTLNPIEWGDGNKVKLIILFAIKNEDIDETEKITIKEFSTLLAEETFIDYLLMCNDKVNIMELINKALNLC